MDMRAALGMTGAWFTAGKCTGSSKVPLLESTAPGDRAQFETRGAESSSGTFFQFQRGMPQQR